MTTSHKRPRHPRKRPGLALTVLGLLLAGCGADTDPVDTAKASALRVSVQTLHLTRDPVIPHRATGLVRAVEEAQLGFELGGTVATLRVDEGARVAAGDVLARLDTARLEARREEARAARGEAAASLALAVSTLDRIAPATAAGAFSPQRRDEAQRQAEAARARLERAEASLAAVMVDLDKAVLRAPFAGDVVARLADPGTVVAAGMPVLHLQSTGAREVVVGLAPALANELAPDDSLTLREPRYRDEAARVLSLIPRRTAGTRVVEVILRLDDPEGHWRPGDLVALDIPAPIRGEGFWLPRAALTDNARGLWAVYAVDATRDPPVVRRRDVALLYTTGSRVFVRGDLAAGDRVVTAGVPRLVPGLAVDPQPAGD